MKKLLTFIALLISLGSMAQFKSAALTASGLTCSMCSKAIFKALEKVSFVESIDANIKTSTYTITFKKNTVIGPDVLSKAVEGAGFSIAKLQLKIVFDKARVENDSHISIEGKTFHFVNVVPQTLNGEKILTLIDKAFTTTKVHKKYKQYTGMKCYETGKMETCCKTGTNADRIYHVTI